MGGAIIQDEGHGLHLTAHGFGDNNLLDKGLEIDKAFAAPTGPTDLSIRDTQAGKQVTCASAMIARLL